jgi:hypothetical protein
VWYVGGGKSVALAARSRWGTVACICWVLAWRGDLVRKPLTFSSTVRAKGMDHFDSNARE